jgi:hypothetical protein
MFLGNDLRRPIQNVVRVSGCGLEVLWKVWDRKWAMPLKENHRRFKWQAI